MPLIKRDDMVMFTLNEDAKFLFDSWSQSRYEGTTSAYLARSEIHALKLAMHEAFCEHPEDSVINEKDMENAIELMRIINKSALLVLDGIKSVRPLDDLLNIINGRPGISHRDLLTASGINRKPFKECIETLIERGDVECKNHSGTKKYWRLEHVQGSETVGDEPKDEKADDSPGQELEKVEEDSHTGGTKSPRAEDKGLEAGLPDKDLDDGNSLRTGPSGTVQVGEDRNHSEQPKGSDAITPSDQFRVEKAIPARRRGRTRGMVVQNVPCPNQTKTPRKVAKKRRRYVANNAPDAVDLPGLDEHTAEGW
jgi:hypothetical protein